MRNLYVTGVQRCGLPIKLVLRPHRLPGEPVRAYRAFRMYRDQGPHRSGATRQSVGHWTAWSKQWNWVERAGAYDTLVDKSEQKAQCYRAIELEKRRLDFEIANQHRLPSGVSFCFRETWARVPTSLTARKIAGTPQKS